MENSYQDDAILSSEDQQSIGQSLEKKLVPAHALRKKKNKDRKVQVTIRLSIEEDELLSKEFLSSPFLSYSAFLVNEILLSVDNRHDTKPNEVKKLKVKITELENKLTNLRKAYAGVRKKMESRDGNPK